MIRREPADPLFREWDDIVSAAQRFGVSMGVLITAGLAMAALGSFAKGIGL